MPGDRDGGEFPVDSEMTERCRRLFLRLEEEFEVSVIDLSAGRSYATDLVLAATSGLDQVTIRWLVFHRWTRQHVIAASGLVYGQHGILAAGVEHGHPRERLVDSIRFVRTAFVDPDSPELAGLRAGQVAWLRACHQDLLEMAAEHRLGNMLVLGVVPLDPVLQWREQLISDNDVWARKIANVTTIDAFDSLARRLSEPSAWMSR
jgi:hypothetical protein